MSEDDLFFTMDPVPHETPPTPGGHSGVSSTTDVAAPPQYGTVVANAEPALRSHLRLIQALDCPLVHGSRMMFSKDDIITEGDVRMHLGTNFSCALCQQITDCGVYTRAHLILCMACVASVLEELPSGGVPLK